MNKYHLNIKLHDASLSDFYQERKNYQNDSGYDLYCPEEIIVPPNSVGTLDFKLSCSPEFKDEFSHKIISGYYLYPRSSISKTPLIMANSIGIIDHGYRGNIMAKVFNTSKDPYVVKQGERLFQLCMSTLQPFTVNFVDQLDSTLRGSGGFGSTGK
jgi:dUTP pyrophosphatase